MSKKGNLTVAVQAGGDALVNAQFLEGRLLDRAIVRLGGIADEIIITTNKADRIKEKRAGVRVVVDAVERKKEGYYKGNSLEGIRTALAAASNDYVAIVAGDMPFPSASIIGYELKLLKKTGADLVIPHTRHGLEPFCAVYRRSTCLAAVQEGLAKSARCCTSLAKYVRTIEFNEEQALAVDPRGGSFATLNSPRAVRRMDQRIKKGLMEKKGDFEGEKRAA